MTSAPAPHEAVELGERAALIDGETHRAHREIELAADAFAAALADYVAGRIHAGLVHAAAQATAPVKE